MQGCPAEVVTLCGWLDRKPIGRVIEPSRAQSLLSVVIAVDCRIMDTQRIAGPLKALVVKLLKDSDQGSGNTGSVPEASLARTYQYTLRLLGSRISAPLASDEAAIVDAIKRSFIHKGRASDALAFADLHRKLGGPPGPGKLEKRWSLLYLLKTIAEDRCASSVASCLLWKVPARSADRDVSHW